MLALTRIRDLDLNTPSSAGRPHHLSAASGLVRLGSTLYVVADDELHLGVFEVAGRDPGYLLRLFQGELPDGAKKRKAKKPDTEVLLRLPPFTGHAHGALLALGSGSKPQRCLGALLRLEASGLAGGDSGQIELTPLYAALERQLDGLNIEGGMIMGDEVCLLQRGNKRGGQNALVRFTLADLTDLLVAPERAAAMTTLSVRPVELGDIDGVALCFTDGSALPNGDIVFSAVAEATEDTYHDGPCVGAAIGVVTRHGDLRCLHRVAQDCKIEGIDATVEGDRIRLLAVTDADDAAIPAGLYSAEISIDS